MVTRMVRGGGGCDACEVCANAIGGITIATNNGVANLRQVPKADIARYPRVGVLTFVTLLFFWLLCNRVC